MVDEFEQHRPHLQAVAYRMLGSMSDAEDALQEAWLRLNRADTSGVANMAGWLTTVVGRVCLDMLRTRRARREESLDEWLPEPIVSFDEPEESAVLADSVGLALFVVLETLTPTERLAFVLHDMFGIPFDQIAPIVDRTPEAARQLASRARRRVRGLAPVPDADLHRQREVVDAFLAASRAGDFEALLDVLDPGVVFRIGKLEPVVGAENVARRVLARGTPLAPLARPALVNGAAGAVVPGLAIVGFTVVDGRIAAIDLIVDPERVRRATA
jgi:RNA polymerase sigma factor (sigma-70 family)